VTELLVGVPFPPAAMEIMRCACVPQYFEDALFSGATYVPPQALERGMIHEIAEPDALLDRAVAVAKTLAALSPRAFAQTKRQTREPMLERMASVETAAAVEEIWTAPETLERIRDYVAHTLRKS
jgi:enoyl-CoA hydratase